MKPITTFVTLDSTDPHRINVVQMPVFTESGDKKFHVLDSEGRLHIAEKFGYMVRPVKDVGNLIAVLKGAMDEDEVRLRLAGSPIIDDDTQITIFSWKEESEWSPQVIVTPRKNLLKD